MIGKIYAKDAVPEGASRKYFWRIYTNLYENSDVNGGKNSTQTKRLRKFQISTTTEEEFCESDSTISNANKDEFENVHHRTLIDSDTEKVEKSEPSSTSSSADISTTEICSSTASSVSRTKFNEKIQSSTVLDSNLQYDRTIDNNDSDDEFRHITEPNRIEDYFYIDGADPNESNWMRYVNPAYSSTAQNLVACQINREIYFYTIKPIPPDQELLVWYCREFAQRLNYPASGEQMMLRIRKSS